MNYTMLDMLAEDVNTPEIGNPARWSNKPAKSGRLAKAAAKAAFAATALVRLMTAIFVR